jgi:hypothetical protein
MYERNKILSLPVEQRCRATAIGKAFITFGVGWSLGLIVILLVLVSIFFQFEIKFSQYWFIKSLMKSEVF